MELIASGNDLYNKLIDYNRGRNFSRKGCDIIFDLLEETNNCDCRELDGYVPVDIVSIAVGFTEYKTPADYVNEYLTDRELDQFMEEHDIEDEDEITWDDLARDGLVNYSNSVYWQDDDGIGILSE